MWSSPPGSTTECGLPVPTATSSRGPHSPRRAAIRSTRQSSASSPQAHEGPIRGCRQLPKLPPWMSWRLLKRASESCDWPRSTGVVACGSARNHIPWTSTTLKISDQLRKELIAWGALLDAQLSGGERPDWSFRSDRLLTAFNSIGLALAEKLSVELPDWDIEYWPWAAGEPRIVRFLTLEERRNAHEVEFEAAPVKVPAEPTDNPE